MPNILALWPVAKWILQALGLMGPEDREKEKEYRLKLLEAAERKEEAMVKAFADFQGLWRPSAERVYVWANTAIALFQPAILGLVYYDVIWGRRQSIRAAVELEKAGIPGLLIMAIMLFPFYGPALVSSVGDAFRSAVDLAVKRRNGNATTPGRTKSEQPGVVVPQPGEDAPETERQRLERLNRERNDAIINAADNGGASPDDPDDDGRDHE